MRPWLLAAMWGMALLTGAAGAQSPMPPADLLTDVADDGSLVEGLSSDDPHVRLVAARALGRLHGVSVEAMVDIADSLGSDVPACLFGRAAIGRGRGEQLEPVPGMPGTPVLLVNPGVAVSTAEVFHRWDGVDR